MLLPSKHSGCDRCYFSTTLAVTGATTLSSTLAVTGATGIDGDFDINTNKFTVAASSGNTEIAGTLDVTGATTLYDALTVSEMYQSHPVLLLILMAL